MNTKFTKCPSCEVNIYHGAMHRCMTMGDTPEFISMGTSGSKGSHCEHSGVMLDKDVKIFDEWGFNFCIEMTLSHLEKVTISDINKSVEDLKKARWYVDHAIKALEIKVVKNE